MRLPLPARRLASALGLPLVLLLSACGGGSDATDAAAGPTFTEQSTAATVSRALGGQVQLDGLQLAVPAQAVGSQDLALALRTQAPTEGALAAFAFSPAGERLRQGATLSFTRAGLPAQARFFWVVDGQRIALPGQVTDGTLTSTVSHLGYLPGLQRLSLARSPLARRASGPDQQRQSARARVLADAAPGAGQLEVRLLACQQQVDALELRFRTLSWERDTDVALALFNEYEALKADCTELDNTAVIARACAALTQAADDAQVLAADSFENFRDITARLSNAGSLLQLTGGECPVTQGQAPDAYAAQMLATKFDQFLDFVDARLQRTGLSDSPTQRDLAMLFGLASDCAQLELAQVCDRITGSLYPRVLDQMRTVAFDACRTGSNQNVAMLRALGQDDSTPQRFYGFANYSPDDLVRDAAYCRDASLSLRVFQLAGEVPDELAARRVEHQVLGSQGEYRTDVSARVPLTGSLTLGARIPVLKCPDDSTVRDELVLALDGREVARYAQSGETYTLATRALDWVAAAELPRLGLPSEPAARVMTLNREPGVCDDDTALASPRMTLFFVALSLVEEAPDAPPPVEVKPVSWNGEVTVTQSFTMTWAQTRERDAEIRCGFLGSGGTCRTTNDGSLSGEVRSVWAMASVAPTVPGNLGDLRRELTSRHLQVSRSMQGRYAGTQGTCSRSGNNASTATSQEANGGRDLQAWHLSLGMDGSFTLQPGEAMLTTQMQTTGGTGSGTISTGCTVPAGSSSFAFPPGPADTIELRQPLMPVISGRVDPQAGVLSGSARDTKTFTGSGCTIFLTDVPGTAFEGTPTTSEITCSITMETAWRLTRQ